MSLMSDIEFDATRTPAVGSAVGGADLLAAGREHQGALRELLDSHGALILRGFRVGDATALTTLLEDLWGRPLDYVYRSTPRTNVGAGLYTATEYPAALEIPLHCENAYQRDWPTRIGFHCVTPAGTGGQTPIADVERVTSRIDPGILREFEARQVRYVRNYSDHVDLPWTTVFQTKDKAEVEQYCRSKDIAFEWVGGGLRTWQTCQGVLQHPDRGSTLWFNQAHLFHVSALGQEAAAEFIDLFGEEGLPRNAFFGDGEKIPADVLDNVRAAFEQEKIVFDWQKDDILLLDNMRFAHGRLAFSGSRRVLVGMAAPFSARH